MKNISLNIDKALGTVTKEQVYAQAAKAHECNATLQNGNGAGNDFLGWLHLPSSITDAELTDIENTANVLRSKCEVVVAIGIGGSYLGTKAVVEALNNSFDWLKRVDIILAIKCVVFPCDMKGGSLEHTSGRMFAAVFQHIVGKGEGITAAGDIQPREDVVAGRKRQHITLLVRVAQVAVVDPEGILHAQVTAFHVRTPELLHEFRPFVVTLEATVKVKILAPREQVGRSTSVCQSPSGNRTY